MKRVTGIAQAPALDYAGTVLAARLAELRRAFSRGDLGASAIELAVITAIIAVAAVALAVIIQSVVARKGAIINGL